ncbi:MAG: hypothetical protein JNK79_16865 [Chitinophagaceae bacterium]|nr:hypothetical protein [Chitinophagaceae bacterium]
MPSDHKTKSTSLLHAVWPGALVIVVAAGIIGAGALKPLEKKLFDRNVAAYDKLRGTNFHSNYLTEKEYFFDDYCSADRKKLAAFEKENMAIVASIRDKSKKEALGYIVIFPVVVLVGYILLVKYLKRRKPSIKNYLHEEKVYH